MMSDEKSKKALKLKTFDEIQNDGVYDIHFFPKKRRTHPPNKSSAPTTPNDDDVEEQVITDSDNGEDSDDDMAMGNNDKSITTITTGQKRQKQRKTYNPELLPMNFDDPSKSMINLSNYLMKRRKWPYRGWHKRFFFLQNGYMLYGKSEQDVKRGRLNGKCDIGLCIVTFIRESQRINIDETNSIYHIKIKDKKTFEQWLEQIALHRNYRQKILDQQSPVIKSDEIQNKLSNSALSATDRLFYNDFADIQVQLSSLSDILEHIKTNTNSTTTSSVSSKSTVK
jgi:hypothetical protein